ncbi:pentatricopeptide repeat-containing protein At5g08510-like [Rosa chinensis]|uniref:pentatricopeptide repeat-containing protein At5g08510-like n=1 Tax=Rosa chinensis TaxID=74649 RepID=UPI001AD91E80|nr:pentatricopeptide repeat-containing protein At5g08510-like [Rosa chinensis]
MLIEGVNPDQLTFVGMLSACSHSGLVDWGLKLFKSMTQVNLIEPLAEHYACMVDLLGRAGRLEEAFEIVRDMKIKATARMWGALLGASRIHRNLKFANYATKKLLELKPDKTSNFVLLSNMNAEAGRWDEVEIVSMLINQRKMAPAAVGNHAILFDDPVQPRTAEICSVLNSLAREMKNTSSFDECFTTYRYDKWLC